MAGARAHVVVKGRVQGVFFRQSVADLARSRGVSGWVRNRTDGRVEAVFEGSHGDVAACVEFCRTGPRGARVDDVEVVCDEVEGWEPGSGRSALGAFKVVR